MATFPRLTTEAELRGLFNILAVLFKVTGSRLQSILSLIQNILRSAEIGGTSR